MTSSPISRWSAEEWPGGSRRDEWDDRYAEPRWTPSDHELVALDFLDVTDWHAEPPVDEPPRRVSAGWVLGVILVALVVGVVLWRLRHG